MNTLRKIAVVSLIVPIAWHAGAQTPPAAQQPSEEDVIVLSPFEVTADVTGYVAGSTLAGNRLNTDVRDIGNAVTVITSQFLKDIGATDNKTLLQYTTNTEVGGVYGNFAGLGDGSRLDESGRFTNPNNSTRVRGLTSADNTREYFTSSVPWEGYNVDGVDLQRGPNSILFGQGSPAGIINTRLKQATFKDSNEVTFRVGSWGATRGTLDINKVLVKNELAIRIAAVRNDEQYKQDPAYSEQNRVYGAVRWEPGLLKRGSARTVVKANVEFGEIESNNPRQLPPGDRITPWFLSGTYDGRNVANQPFSFPQLNKITVNPAQYVDDNTGRPNTGMDRPSHNGPTGNYSGYLIPKYANDPNFASGLFSGTPNEYYQPWLAGSMLGSFGSPVFNFQYDNATQGTAVMWEPTGNHGMLPNGVNGVRTSSVGIRYMRPASISTYSDYARKAKLYYNGLPAWQFGIFKDKSLTDPTVFDFYNNLLDGPTKWEFQNFRNFNVSIAQTFFNDKIGLEASYNNEWYKSGKVQLIGDDSINIDINTVYSDGSPTGKNGIPWEDGTPNPNLGKAYTGGSGIFGNNVAVRDREAKRLTAFAENDFNKNHRNWFTRLMGRHVITGLWAEDEDEFKDQQFSRYSIDDPAWHYVVNAQPTATPQISYLDARLQPFTMIYLGDSLKSASSASGANIPNVQALPSLTSGKTINFDATWNRSTTVGNPNYVDPAAVWHDDYYPYPGQVPFTTDGNYRDANGNIVLAPNAPGYGTQSENLDNYVGFREFPINIIDSLASAENMLRNTREMRLTRSQVTSKAFNWQAHLWDKAVVATWGVRKDTARAWQAARNTNQGDVNNYRRVDYSNFALSTNPTNTLEVTSHAWTAVAHLNELPVFDRLPFLVSVFYNHSTNFQPAAQRVDVYGESLSAPSGKTKDVGILLETKDGKWSLKINKYDTASVNASSSALGGAWFIGTSQAWANNWVNRFEFNWRADHIGGAADPNDADYATNSMFNYATAPGETQAQAAAREASVIQAWRAWQASVDPRFYQAWGINMTNNSTRTQGTTASVPSGFAVTEDSTSSGYEIELNASPTRNWRLSINASKNEAQRTNIGGTNLRAFMAAYTSFLGTGAPGTGGDLRIWWGGAGNETALQQWNNNINSEFNQRKLQEGTNVPELREWRVNGITNYQFDHGPFKNFNIGGGVRYESSIVIGYEPIPGATPTEVSFDIANPYRGPSEINYDLWLGYRRKIWRNIDWSVQLNVRNVGAGNELIPVTTQPDGSPATFRIRPPQSWQITNTFRF